MEALRIYPVRWWTLAVLCLGLLMITIDNTIVNVALPTLAIELRASASQLQWIVEAYSLVFAGLLLSGGTLSDRYGSRRVLMVGLTVFGLASTIGAFVPSVGALIATRAMMGLGGSLIMPSTLAVIKHIFPEGERTRAIGIWAATASLGVAAGPLAGGWLLQYFWWGAIFLVNVPLVLLTIVASWRLIPTTLPTRSVPLDLAGASLSFVGIASLVYAVIEGPHWGWTSFTTGSMILTATILLSLFVWWERRTAYPMLQISLFRNRIFSVAIGANLLAFMALAGFSFVLPQFLQSVQGYSPLEAGVRTLPIAAAVATAGVLAAWVTRRVGNKVMIAGGLALTTVALALLSLITATSSYSVLLWSMLLLGLGVGSAYTSGTDAVLGVVPPEQAGAASATNEMSLELGTALGIAVLGSVLSSRYSSAIGAVSQLPEAVRGTAAESIGAAVRVASELGGGSGATLLQHARTAFTGAMQTTTFLGMGISLLGVLLALVYLPGHKSPGAPPQQMLS